MPPVEEHKSVAFLRHTLGLLYTLALLAVGMSTSVYFAMSDDASQSTQFHDAFFFAMYLTGIGAVVWLGVYTWRYRGARFHSQGRQIRMESLAMGHRLAGIAPPAQLPHVATSSGEEAESPERMSGSLPYVAHCGEGFNAYLHAGLALFAVGTVAFDLLRIAVPYLDPGNPACGANGFKPALYACQLLFVVACGCLLSVNHRAVFLRHRGMASALLGHLLTACLCVWAHSSVADIVDSVLLARPLATTKPEHANATTTAAALAAAAACPAGRRALDSVGPYLVPAKIEFALLAAPMTVQLLAYIGDHRMVEAKETVDAEAAAAETSFAEDDDTEKVDSRHGKLQSKEERSGEDSGAPDWLSRLNVALTLRDMIGPAVGLAIFLVTLAVSTCVLSLADHRAAALAYLGHTALLHAAAVVAAAAALCRIRQLEFVRAERHAFDDRLLIAAFLGGLLYSVFMLCALLANVAAYPAELAALEGLAGLLGVSQTVLQAALLLDGLRRRCATADQLARQPGRGLVAVLLGINLSLWLLGTFESRRMDGVADALLSGRVSVIGYRLVMHIGLPFAILFRFHSSVCFSLIWGKAYTSEEE